MPGPYRVLIQPWAEKAIWNLPKWDKQRVLKKIISLADDPRPQECLKLFGEDGYRIRQGDYRILYRIDDSERTVVVFRVAHRRESYRG